MVQNHSPLLNNQLMRSMLSWRRQSRDWLMKSIRWWSPGHAERCTNRMQSLRLSCRNFVLALSRKPKSLNTDSVLFLHSVQTWVQTDVIEAWSNKKIQCARCYAFGLCCVLATIAARHNRMWIDSCIRLSLYQNARVWIALVFHAQTSFFFVSCPLCLSRQISTMKSPVLYVFSFSFSFKHTQFSLETKKNYSQIQYGRMNEKMRAHTKCKEFCNCTSIFTWTVIDSNLIKKIEEFHCKSKIRYEKEKSLIELDAGTMWFILEKTA